MSEQQNSNTPSDEEIRGFDDQPRKTPRWIKYMGGTAIGLVILAGGVSVVATQLIDQQKYKKIIVEKIEQNSGYQVDWSGNISLSLLPLPHATVDNLTVTANGQKFISVKSVNIDVALWPLLSRKVNIKDVSLEEPEITLITTKDGQKNWITDKVANNKTQDKEEKNSDTEKEDPSSEMEVSVNILEIINGVFIWDDQSSSNKKIVEDIDVRMAADSLSGPFEMNGGVVLDGKKVEARITTSEIDIESGKFPLQVKLALPQSNISGKYTGIITTKPSLNVEGDVAIESTDLSASLSSLSGESSVSLPDELKGKSGLEGKIFFTPENIGVKEMQIQIGELSYGGNFAVSGLGNNKKPPQILFDLKSNKKAGGNASALVKFFDDLSMKASGNIDGDKITIDNSHIRLEENDIAIKGSVINGEKKSIDLIVSSHQMDLDQIEKKMGVKQVGATASSPSVEAIDSSNDKGDFGFVLPFDGRVRTDIDKLITKGKTYSDIHVDMTSSNAALRVENFSAQLPEDVSLSASGKIGNTKDMSGLDMAIKASVKDADKLARIYNVTLPDLPRKVGAVSLDSKISGNMKALGFDANVKAMGFSVNGVGAVASPLNKPVINTLKFSLEHGSFVDAVRIMQPSFSTSTGFTGPLSLSGQVTWGDEQYHLTNLNGMLGKTSIDGTVDWATQPKTLISGEINIGDLVLPAANNVGKSPSTMASPSRAAPSNGIDDKARWSREAIDMSWMKKIDADLKVKAKSITQNLWKFTNANLVFSLKDGNLQIEDMSAGLFGGQAAVNGKIKSGAGERDPLGISGKMTASNVNAQQLLGAATGKPGDTLTGIIKTVDIDINATGLSPAALIQTLSGKGSMNGENITVKGIDAAQLAMAAKGSYKPLERAGTMFGSFGQGQTEFTIFESEFDIQSGIVTFSKSIFDGPKANLSSVGNVNLPLWTIDLKNTMTVKNTDIPPFDFTIKGPLDSPTKAGGDVIENYLRGRVEKKVNKLIENQLNKFLGGESNAEAPSPTPDSSPITDAPIIEGDVPPAPASEKVNPKDALKKDALKALGGLLGQ